MLTDPELGVAWTPIGTDGSPYGVPKIEMEPETPTALIATTLNSYVVPLIRPVNVADRSVTVCACRLNPGRRDTRYPVMGLPPSYGADQSNVADESKTCMESPVGTDGLVAGTTDPDIVAAETPTAFVALTLTLYAVPRVNVEKNVDRVVTVLVSRMLEDGSKRFTEYDVIGDP
jgi:hypothetical protein